MAKQEKISSDIRKKIKQIEIQTRRLLRGSQVGDSRSALKGTGFEFDQIREYQQGDDVRFIDWNASARLGNLLVKQYVEERSRTVIIALDISGSSQFGSNGNLKRDTMAQIASVLALIANFGKDRVGLLLFSDMVEEFIPPSRGTNHVYAIMEKLFCYTPKRTKTNITSIFKKLATFRFHDSIQFIISDFIDDHVDRSYIAPICKKHDIIGIRCLDYHEKHIPSIGFIPMIDKETNELITVDVRDNSDISSFLNDRFNQQNKLYRGCGMQLLDVANNSNFIGDIIRFFRRRMRY